MAGAARAFVERAHAASRALLEIKGAHPGYVAAGQGEDYWIAKVDALIVIGARIAGHASIGGAVGQRARRARSGRRDPRRLRSDGPTGARLRTQRPASPRVRPGVLRRHREDGCGGCGGRAGAPDRGGDDARGRQRRTARRADGNGGRGGDRPAADVPAGAAATRPGSGPRCRCQTATRPAAAESPARKGPTGPPRAVVPTPPAPPAPIVAAKPAGPALDLPGMAALCSDLSRAVDTRALPPALERAARLLDASGLVIWIADPDGRELMPVMAHGYPQNLVSRLGTIARDAENVTAAAFRTGLVQTVNGRCHLARRHCRPAVDARRASRRHGGGSPQRRRAPRVDESSGCHRRGPARHPDGAARSAQPRKN